MYHHHVQHNPPFTVGCFGPSASGGLVSLEECRALYTGSQGCGGDDIVTVTTPAGSKQYDLWCPCYDSRGLNVAGGSGTPSSAGSSAPSSSSSSSPSSSSSSPSSSSPSSPSTAGAGATPQYKVAFSLRAAGDVSDYTGSKIDAMRRDIAIAAGVLYSDVEVAVASGSVVVSVTIIVASAATASVVTSTITPKLASTSAASGIFTTAGVAVESVASSPQTVAPSAGLGTGPLVAIIAGGAVAALLLVYYVGCHRKEAPCGNTYPANKV